MDKTNFSESLFKNEQGSNVKTEARAVMCSEKPRKHSSERDTNEAGEQGEAKTKDHEIAEKWKK